MTQTPEIPVQPEIPTAPESMGEIPAEIEQGQPQSVVQQQPQQVSRPTTTVTTNSSNPSTPTVTVPADPAQLTQLAKGNPANAITWFAYFWLRVIKKALALGASIMTSQSINIPAPVQGSTNDNSISKQNTAETLVKVTQTAPGASNITQFEEVESK